MVLDLSERGLVALDFASPQSEASVIVAEDERRRTGRRAPANAPVVAAGLRTLVAANNSIEMLRGLPQAAANLRTLVLHDNCLSRLDASTQLPRGLRVLDLAGNLLPSLDFVAALPFLTSLDVSRNAIRALTIGGGGGGSVRRSRGGGGGFTAQATVLRTLVCSDNAIDTLGGVADAFPAVEVLDIARNPCVDRTLLLTASDDDESADDAGNSTADVQHIRAALQARSGLMYLPQLTTLTIGVVAAASAQVLSPGPRARHAERPVDLAAAVLASVCAVLPDLRSLDGVNLDHDVAIPRDDADIEPHLPPSVDRTATMAGSNDSDSATDQEEEDTAAEPATSVAGVADVAEPMREVPLRLAPHVPPSDSSRGEAADMASQCSSRSTGACTDEVEFTDAAAVVASEAVTRNGALADLEATVSELASETGERGGDDDDADQRPILPPRARVRLGPPSRAASTATDRSFAAGSDAGSEEEHAPADPTPTASGADSTAIAERLLSLASSGATQRHIDAPSSAKATAIAAGDNTSIGALSSITKDTQNYNVSIRPRSAESRRATSIDDSSASVARSAVSNSVTRNARMEALRARVAAQEAELFILRDETVSLATEAASLESEVARERKEVAKSTSELTAIRGEIDGLRREAETLRFKASKRFADVAHAEMAAASAETRQNKYLQREAARAAEEERNAQRMRRVANTSIRQGLQARKRDEASMVARRQQQAYEQAALSGAGSNGTSTTAAPKPAARQGADTAGPRRHPAAAAKLQRELEPASFRDFLAEEDRSGIVAASPLPTTSAARARGVASVGVSADETTMHELAVQARLLEAANADFGTSSELGGPDRQFEVQPAVPAEAILELSPPRAHEASRSSIESRVPRRAGNAQGDQASMPRHRLPRVNVPPSPMR